MKDKIKECANKVKTVDYKLISSYQYDFLGIEVYDAKLANGKVKRIERVLKDKSDGDAVIIIPITKEGNYIIVVQSRPNIVDTGGVAIEFPAGMVDEGEEFESAAKRELEEETGYVCSGLKPIEWHYQDQGCSNAKIKTFLAMDCEKKSKQHLDPGELLEPLEISLDDLMGLYDSNLMNDAGSRLALLSYLRKCNK